MNCRDRRFGGDGRDHPAALAAAGRSRRKSSPSVGSGLRATPHRRIASAANSVVSFGHAARKVDRATRPAASSVLLVDQTDKTQMTHNETSRCLTLNRISDWPPVSDSAHQFASTGRDFKALHIVLGTDSSGSSSHRYQDVVRSSAFRRLSRTRLKPELRTTNLAHRIIFNFFQNSWQSLASDPQFLLNGRTPAINDPRST